MTATEELRRILDERGIEWDKGAFPNEARTYWQDAFARPWNEQRLYVAALLTPEQAAEATLGREKCEYDSVNQCINLESGAVYGFEHVFTCGHSFISARNTHVKFCPECGKEVEQ